MLFLFQQLTSGYVIVFYAVDIFKKIGGNFKHIGLIDEFVALILLGGIRFVMSIVLAVISKKIGRRFLMFISAVGMIATSFSLGLYMYLTRSSPIMSQGYNDDQSNQINIQIQNQTIENSMGYGSDSDGTIAVILVLCYICFCSFGWLVIPWTLMGELLPVKVRGVLGGVVFSAAYMLMFVMVKIAPFLMESVRLEFIFFGLSVVNVFGGAFLYIFLPETFGKTFNDIANYFDDNYKE